jgi:hypothetical protein
MPQQLPKEFWSLKKSVCWIAVGIPAEDSALDVILERTYDGLDATDVQERFKIAEQQIVEALRTGKLMAIGRKCIPLDRAGDTTSLTPHAEIPAIWWLTAQVDIEESRASPEDRRRRDLWLYQDIRISATAARELRTEAARERWDEAAREHSPL